jgi:hypothetical protein
MVKKEDFVDKLNKVFEKLNVDDSKKVSKGQILKAYEEIKNDISKSTDKKNKDINKSDRNNNKPKRTLSGYQLFSKDIRSKVKDENPNATPQEITKIIAEKWNYLKGNDKEKYQEYLDKASNLKD